MKIGFRLLPAPLGALILLYGCFPVFWLFAQICGAGGPCNAVSAENVVYVDGKVHKTIESCLQAAGADGTCVVPASFSETLTYPAQLNIQTPGTTLRCEPGAVIQQGPGFHSAHLIVIAARNVTITGCTLRGDASAENSALVSAIGVSGVTISNNTLEAVSNRNFGLYISKGTKEFRIEGNTFTSRMAGRPIYVISNLKGTVIKDGLIRGNTIATTGGTSEDDVILFNNNPAAGLSNVEISNNVMSAGPESCANGGCFCVEVGGFGGPGPTDIAVNENSCSATAAINGGYSLAGTPPSRYRVTKNIYDANYEKTVIAAYEVSGRDASVSDNVARNMIGPGYCVSVNMLSSSSVTENDCTGFSNATNGAGIMVYGGFAGRAGNNTISHNRIVFPEASGNRHYGIWVQCNHASVDCSGNRIVDNEIEGNGGSETRGIMLERDYGTLSSTTVDKNEILHTDIGVYIGMGVIGTRYEAGENDAEIPVVNHGTNTVTR